MIPEFSDNPLYSAWPFWVLGLTPQANTQDVDRAAREITARLSMKLSGADEFSLPNGKAVRDEFLVREARARLFDPASRLLCEFWYVPPPLVAESYPPAAVARLSAEQWWHMLEKNICTV